MSSVSAISSTDSALLGATNTSDAARIPQKTLGKDDFMKLLAVQFQMQDPMKPMDDTSFIAQTAQFTNLETTSKMSDTLDSLRADQQRVVANSYLGHKVTVDDGNDLTASGEVTAIDNTGAAPRLIVNGKSYDLSAVLRVEPGVVSAPASGLAVGGA